MGNKMEFREKLKTILDTAQAKNKVLEIWEVEKFFEHDNLSEEQMELVYDYLLSQKVAVKGYVKKGGTVKDASMVSHGCADSREGLTEEEEAYLKTYLQELKSFKPELPGEGQAIYEQLVRNEAAEKNRLIEIYLPEVVCIAKSMERAGVFLGDLVQEGNVGLMMAVAAAVEDQVPPDQLHAIISAGIRQSMQMLIEEQIDAKKKEQNIVEKVNYINTSINNLSEELGETITRGELALYLDMSEEEIKDILKLAGEEMEETDD